MLITLRNSLDFDDRADKIILSAELPGLSDKDVQVEINRDLLTIKGEKKSQREDKAKGRYFCERSFGSFERTIPLPQGIDREKIEASVKDGVLTVVVPKSAEAKSDVRQIPVRH